MPRACRGDLARPDFPIMRATTHRFVLYPICALALLAASCAGPGGGGRSVGVEPAKPKEVPPPAPPRDVPVDPALQAAANDVLNRSLSASDPVLRAHAIEGLRETQGESAGPRIVQAISDSEVPVSPRSRAQCVAEKDAQQDRLLAEQRETAPVPDG